jgi:hypothetical protein
MGIFTNPDRLAKILASVKVLDRTAKRPLKPVQVARELQEALKELGGDKDKVMKRFNIGIDMWKGFEGLLGISPNIENGIDWGESDPETLTIGFSAAHYMAEFSHENQEKLVAASWEFEKPLRKQNMRDIKQYMKNNPKVTINDAIEKILQFHLREDRRIITTLYFAGLDESIYQNLKNESEQNNITLKELATKILSKKLPDGAIQSAKPSPDSIRIIFSDKGKSEFEKLLKQSNVERNDFVNHLFAEEGF